MRWDNLGKLIISRHEFEKCHIEIIRTEGSQSRDVLYYFPGTLQDEHAWYDGMSAKANYHIHKLLGPDVPVIVTIFFDKVYLFDEERIKVAHAVMPEIDKLVEPYRNRYIMGMSAGAFNVIQLLRESEAFDRAVIIAPVMPLVDPFASPVKRLIQYFGRRYKGCRIYANWGVTAMIRYFFETKDEWARVDPVHIRHIKCPVLVVCGKKDVFGFYKPVKEWYMNLIGIAEWAEHDGGHETGCVEDIAQFLKH